MRVDQVYAIITEIEGAVKMYEQRKQIHEMEIAKLKELTNFFFEVQKTITRYYELASQTPYEDLGENAMETLDQLARLFTPMTIDPAYYEDTDPGTK